MKRILLSLLVFIAFSCKEEEEHLIMATDNEQFNIGFQKFSIHDDPEGSIPYFTRALEKEDQREWSYELRGRAKVKVGDYRGAIADINKALKLHHQRDTIYVSSIASYYSTRAEAKSELGDIMGALSDMDSAIEAYPVRGHLFTRGMMKLKAGFEDSGCMDLSRANDEGHPEALKAIQKFCY